MPEFDRCEFSVYLNAARQAARLAGTLLLEKMGSAQAWEKGPGDWVTAADFAAQELIQTYLADQFPQIGFLGEESGTAENRLSDDNTGSMPLANAVGSDNLPPVPSASQAPQPLQPLRVDAQRLTWIVDPLDGTVNFIHQLPSFSVSIGLVASSVSPITSQEILVGVVYDPMLDECFTAVKQQGAYLNGSPIQVSGCSTLETALTVLSIGRKGGDAGGPNGGQSSFIGSAEIRRMLNVMESPAAMRRLGSAALNLSYIAAGRVDAYWASNLKPWDVAAGWLIAQEAGAVLRGLEDVPLDVMNPDFCCAATVELWNQLNPLLNVSETQ